MQHGLKRVLSGLLATALVAAVLLPHSAQKASALEYKGSAGYMSGKYYRALTEVKLTGDPRTDIVNIARSQVGYQEGGSRNQLSGEVLGSMNFTEISEALQYSTVHHFSRQFKQMFGLTPTEYAKSVK